MHKVTYCDPQHLASIPGIIEHLPLGVTVLACLQQRQSEELSK